MTIRVFKAKSVAGRSAVGCHLTFGYRFLYVAIQKTSRNKSFSEVYNYSLSDFRLGVQIIFLFAVVTPTERELNVKPP